MARAAGDISLKWVAAQEYAISGYQNLANAAYAVGSELDLSALDNVVDLLIGSKHKTASGTLAADPFVQLYELVHRSRQKIHAPLAAHAPVPRSQRHRDADGMNLLNASVH